MKFIPYPLFNFSLTSTTSECYWLFLCQIIAFADHHSYLKMWDWSRAQANFVMYLSTLYFRLFSVFAAQRGFSVNVNFCSIKWIRVTGDTLYRVEVRSAGQPQKLALHQLFSTKKPIGKYCGGKGSVENTSLEYVHILFSKIIIATIHHF